MGISRENRLCRNLGARSESEEALAKIYGFNKNGAHNYPTTSGIWMNYYSRSY